MARTSKKNRNIIIPTCKKVYSVGIYARLSVDSDERKNESIETQIEIAKNYMASRNDMVLYECYTDLGKTGTNFKREGFERMMQDVRQRKIDCIIVKDLSRFGRNYTETGNYIEKIFPFLGVRFIAVVDDYDNMDSTKEKDELTFELKNLVNDLYAKDISVKVKSSKKTKWEQGEFVGSIPPYGYNVEFIDERRVLVSDTESSEIVINIYSMFLSGKNMKEIARWLYENKVLTPKEFRKTGHVYKQEQDCLKEWATDTVKLILSNPTYMGWNLHSINNNDKYIIRDRKDAMEMDLSIKENAHAAIITEEMFFQAAKRFQKTAVYCNKQGYSKRVPLDEDIFEGILYCGSCGKKLGRTNSVKQLSNGSRKRVYGYCCGNARKIDGFSCDGKYIAFNVLQKIVKTAIFQEFMISDIKSKDLIEMNQLEMEKAIEAINTEIQDCERKIENLKQTYSEQYLQYRIGAIGEKEFLQIRTENEKRVKTYENLIFSNSQKQQTVNHVFMEKKKFMRMLMKYDYSLELTKELVNTLIQRIEVYPDKRVKILFKFTRTEITGEALV